MKKVLNVFGIILSFILMLVLSFVITFYALILNVSSFTNETTINKIISDIDLTDTIKIINDGKVWKGFIKIADNHGYTEENVIELLNNEHLKEFVSSYLSLVMDSIIYGSEIDAFSSTELTETISETIDDYNRNNENEISNKTKAEILDFVIENYKYIEEILPTSEDISESVESDTEFVKIRDAYVMITSDQTKGYIILSMIVILLLIAVLRFSYYKWIFYAGISLFLSSLYLFVIDRFLGMIDVNEYLKDGELINNTAVSLIKNASDNLFVTAFILLIIAIFTFVLHHHFKASFHLTKKSKKNKISKKIKSEEESETEIIETEEESE